ncbi:hypothetical protein CPT_Sonora_082 [Stenotrophomonas phage Sonora]|nr:hypothetical protein CPT_Sonora_082 [Stenotrophomonas phage Sonora]
MAHRTSREFLQTLKAGDLLRVNGRLRVLREVKWRQHKDLPPTGWFVFAILRCSWTRRPSTTKNVTDMMNCRVELVARNYVPKHPVSLLLDKDLREKTRTLECCDVIGVIT